MTKLEQIEQIRQKALRDIILILGAGFSPGDVIVDIDIHNQDNNGELAQEARQIGWEADRYDGAAWYTSEQPDKGGVQVFVE